VKLSDLAARQGWENLTPELNQESDADITRGYVSDLLSDVLANAPAGGVLVTIQTHLNVVAVAVHAGLAGVVFAAGRRPEEAVRRKAVEEKLPLFVSTRSAFAVVGELYELGVRGPDA